jgi:hypothetical protein
MVRLMDRQTGGTDELMDRQTGGTDELMDRQTYGWLNGQTDREDR